VWASCDVDNLRSRRVLEKLGFAYERLAEGFAVHPALGSEPRACHVLALELRAA
jgi:RimJ/RimL family protein N-acetyltransferase